MKALQTTQRGGFSIVELLVVIGIIAILMGLLMPVIVGARRDAQSIKCREQMRQLGHAFQMYSSGNRGLLNRNGQQDDWFLLILPDNKWYPTTLYTTAPREEWVSYLYNGYLGDIHHNLNRALHAHAKPSEIILLGEKRLMHGYHYRHPLPGNYYDQVDPLRHGRRLRANYLFLDFHVDNALPDNPVDQQDPWGIMRRVKESARVTQTSRATTSW